MGWLVAAKQFANPEREEGAEGKVEQFFVRFESQDQRIAGLNQDVFVGVIECQLQINGNRPPPPA